MPKLVNKEEKRQMLISAAVKVFAQKGFHQTKMEEIAKLADVGKATLYEYFETKEDLFFSVYDSWMSELEKTVIERSNSAEDALSKADAVRDSAVEFYEKYADSAPILLEFWAHALRSENPKFLDRIRTMKEILAKIGNEITGELVRSGLFIDIEVQSFTQLEAGISDGIFLEWVLSGQKFSLMKAYKFRQSVIGLGLLSDDGRLFVQKKLGEKVRKGFLK